MRPDLPKLATVFIPKTRAVLEHAVSHIFAHNEQGIFRDRDKILRTVCFNIHKHFLLLKLYSYFLKAIQI